MRKQVADSSLYEALGEMKSYVAVAFKNEAGEKSGAFSLGSTKKWIFTLSHERALQSLSKRFGFLVEHFKNKRVIQFLIEASPRLAHIKDINNYSNELKKALHRFCSQANATLGSLYLRDEDRQCYVLQAQYKWHKPEWVNAARYYEQDDWIGARATESQPAIIPDLFHHYELLENTPRYKEQAFGALSPKTVVEAIGLLLQVGGKKLGYLTLFREKDEAFSGFAVLNENEVALSESASDIAGLVYVLRSNRERKWRDAEAKRRQEVYRQLTQFDDKRDFETKVCHEMLKSFHARQAHFYRVEQAEAETRVFWVEGYQRTDKRDIDYEKLPPPEYDSPSLELVKESVNASLSITDRRPTVKVERFGLNPDQHINVVQAAAEGLVTRACVPIKSKNELLGVLDLHWIVGTTRMNSSDMEHDEGQLLSLGSMIGSSYRGKQEALENEKSRLAVEGAGAHAFQYSHRLGNAIQNIYRWTLVVKEDAEEHRPDNIQNLLKEISRASDITRDSTTFGERILSVLSSKCSLHELITQSLNELDPDKQSMLQNNKIELKRDMAENFEILADFNLAKDALVNLLNNAVKAIYDKYFENEQPGELNGATPNLSISAAKTVDGHNVQVVIADCGKGISPDEVKWALDGFVGKQERKGVGVLIARVLLNAQGGQLRYESILGNGTKAIVTLPLADKGEQLCLQILKV